MVPDFRDVIASNAKALEQYGSNPEILTFKRLIKAVLDVIAEDVGTSDAIAFEFDDHSNWENAEDAYKMLRGSIHDPHNMLGHIGHGNAEIIPSLQMADLMVYEGRHAAHAWLNGGQFDRPTFKALSNDPNHAVGFMGVITKEGLLAGVDNFNAIEAVRRAESGV